MKSADDFCIALMKERSRAQVNLRPVPLWWRISPTQHRTLLAQLIERGNLPAEEPALRANDHGRIWGIPYIVSEAVPEGCVMFTTDYKEWHIIKVDA